MCKVMSTEKRKINIQIELSHAEPCSPGISGLRPVEGAGETIIGHGSHQVATPEYSLEARRAGSRPLGVCLGEMVPRYQC